MIRPASSTVREARARKRKEFIPGKMIVRFREGAVMPHLAGTRLQFTAVAALATPEAIAAPMDFLRRNAGLKSVTPLFSTRQGNAARAQVSAGDRHRLAVLSSVADSRNEDLRGINVLELDPKKLTPAILKKLEGSKAVEFAEMMPARWLAAQPVADPMRNLQWALRAIKWFTATIPNAGEVKVGVMDTGIDLTHPDLNGARFTYHHDGLKAQDLIGHGTHVSGIIAATVNNNVGISGVSQCQIEMWKIFGDQPDADGEFYVDGERFLQALNGARSSGIRALNLSIGGPASSQTEALLFRRLEAAGVAVAAAMGNDYEEGNPKEYPGGYPTVLAVGAVTETGARSPFSNTGKHIGLVAPGSNILSTLPMKGSPALSETRYGSWSGTSMATPHVTAAAGLLAAKQPAWNAPQIKEHLTKTALKLSGMGKKAWTAAYGFGMLDLEAALN